VPRKFETAPRRWIRHFRDLRNLRQLFPTGSADPSAPQVISPWLSDIVQPVFQLTPDFRVFPVAQPAAGAEWTLTVPDRVTFRILSIRAQLVTDANAANRLVRGLVTSPAGQFVYHTEAGLVQIASLTRQYCWSNNPYDLAALSPFRQLPLPADLWLRSQFTFTPSTQALQATDQWSGITALVEAWPEI